MGRLYPPSTGCIENLNAYFLRSIPSRVPASLAIKSATQRSSFSAICLAASSAKVSLKELPLKELSLKCWGRRGGVVGSEVMSMETWF